MRYCKSYLHQKSESSKSQHKHTHTRFGSGFQGRVSFTLGYCNPWVLTQGQILGMGFIVTNNAVWVFKSVWECQRERESERDRDSERSKRASSAWNRRFHVWRFQYLLHLFVNYFTRLRAFIISLQHFELIPYLYKQCNESTCQKIKIPKTYSKIFRKTIWPGHCGQTSRFGMNHHSLQ